MRSGVHHDNTCVYAFLARSLRAAKSLFFPTRYHCDVTHFYVDAVLVLKNNKITFSPFLLVPIVWIKSADSVCVYLKTKKQKNQKNGQMVQSQCASSGTPRNIFFFPLFINLRLFSTLVYRQWSLTCYFALRQDYAFSATSSAVIVLFSPPFHWWNETTDHVSNEKEKINNKIKKSWSFILETSFSVDENGKSVDVPTLQHN